METGLELTTIQIIWSWDKSIATIPRHSSISPASIWKGFKPSNLRSVADLVANEEPVFIYIFQDTFSIFSFRGSVWRSLVIILKEILFVGPSPASFFFISSFLQTVNSKLLLSMNGFEPGSSWFDRVDNCGTTTALKRKESTYVIPR